MVRIICVEVERTVTYRRKVWVEVEETAERLLDEKRYPQLFIDEAKDAATEKAKTNTLTGWEPHGVAEYYAVDAVNVEAGHSVDVVI